MLSARTFILGLIFLSLCRTQSTFAQKVPIRTSKTFNPVEGLEGYLLPHYTPGLTEYLGLREGIKMGHGGSGQVFWLEWPGHSKGVMAKFNERIVRASHEASFYAYLDGAGGAPRLLHFDPTNGAMVIECQGSQDLRSLAEVGLPLRQWIKIFLSLTEQLKEVHEAGVVHGDLKPDNVIVTLDRQGQPEARLIDFGLSTLSGTRGAIVIQNALGQRAIVDKKWYAAEFLQGEVLDTRADLVGLAFTMRSTFPDMETHLRSLFTLTGRAMSPQRDQRPSLAHFAAVLKHEYRRLY